MQGVVVQPAGSLDPLAAASLYTGAAGALPIAYQRMQVDTVALQQQLDIQRDFNQRMREALATRDHDLIRAREREEEAALRAERAERAVTETRERLARTEAAATAPPVVVAPAAASQPSSDVSRADFEVLQDGMRRLREEMAMMRSAPAPTPAPSPAPALELAPAPEPAMPSARELEIMQLRARLADLEHAPSSPHAHPDLLRTPVPHPQAVDVEGVRVVPAGATAAPTPPPHSTIGTSPARPRATPDAWGMRRRVEQLEHELKSKDMQLAAYEESLADAMFHRTYAATAVPPPVSAAPPPISISAPGPAPAGGSALTQLRTLMGEAYLLKVALQRQGAAPPHVIQTLDSWIMASHALKKAVVSK